MEAGWLARGQKSMSDEGLARMYGVSVEDRKGPNVSKDVGAKGVCNRTRKE